LLAPWADELREEDASYALHLLLGEGCNHPDAASGFPSFFKRSWFLVRREGSNE
jgi:hypothetical protein